MRRQSPLYFLFVVIASIFLAEAVVMLFLSAFPGFSTIKGIVVDSSMLVIIVSPVLYLFLFRPLVLHIRERQVAEEGIKKHQQMLEGLVELRTAEVMSANEKLRLEIAACKVLEEKRRISEERYRKLVETSTDAIISVNDRREVIQWNNAAAGMFGYTENEMIGKSVDVIVPQEYKDRHIIGFEARLEYGTGNLIGKTAELEGIRKNGTKVPIELSLSIIEVDDSNVITGIIRDITHRKQVEAITKRYSEKLEEKVTERTQKLEAAYTDMEKMVHIIEKSADEQRQKNIELEVARDMAEAGSRAKSEFLANMSHELRTPLNAVIGFSEVMIDGMAGPMTDEQKGFIKDINESGKSLLSMIDDMIDFSRLETGGIRLDYSDVKIKPLIEESLAMFREDMDRHRLKLNIDIERNLGTMEADRDRIKQVAVNLFSNAIKFTLDGGTVSVTARRVGSRESGFGSQELGLQSVINAPRPPLNVKGGEEEFVEISVEDTGIGISGEDMKRLFTPFQQLERHLTKKHGGIGIGLIISKRIIDLHKGKIWVESEAGKGSRFVFSIPVKQVRQEEVNA